MVQAHRHSWVYTLTVRKALQKYTEQSFLYFTDYASKQVLVQVVCIFTGGEVAFTTIQAMLY